VKSKAVEHTTDRGPNSDGLGAALDVSSSIVGLTLEEKVATK